jgi:diguanylate cyclase (GGDEF)-like protein/PAS domain S-box-containing protein
MMPKKNGPVAGQKIPRQKKRDFISPGTVVLRADQSTPSHEKCPTVGIASPVEGTESPSSIEEAYHLLQAILQSTSDGILAVNENNEVLFANERFAKMWRIPQEIMASKDDNLLLQFVLDQLSDPQSFLQKVQELYRSSEENFDTLYFKDGRVFERRTSPILQGTKVQGRVWSFQEITERKRVEEALVKEQHEMQTIMNYLPVNIYFKDRTSRFTRISTSHALRFGLSDPAQAIGKTDFDFFTVEHAQQAFQDEQEIIQTGQPLIKEEKETWIDHPDLWVSTIKMPMQDNEGNIIGTFGLSTDITERKRVEEELRRAKDDHEAILIKLQESLEREKQLANTDGLTGLCNHRHFFELAEHEFQTALRYQHPLSFVMFDIDYFKQVNDTLGHAAGDKLLAKVAQIAAAQVRASDLVARYGGDEFIVALPYTSAQQALAVTERIQKSVAAIPVEPLRTDHESFAITLSIGIAEMRRKATDDNVERIIQRADDASYEAKRSGRNRAVILEQDEI